MQNETPARFVLVQQSRAFGRPRAGDPNFQAAALYRSVPLNIRAAGCNCQFARPGRGPDEGAAGRRPLIPRRVQNWNELRPAKATLALHIKDGYIFRMCKSSRRPFCPNAMVYPALLCVWAFAQTRKQTLSDLMINFAQTLLKKLRNTSIKASMGNFQGGRLTAQSSKLWMRPWPIWKTRSSGVFDTSC